MNHKEKLIKLKEAFKIGKIVTVNPVLNYDLLNKRGEKGKIVDIKDDTITLVFEDGKTGKYSDDALIESYKEKLTKLKEGVIAKIVEEAKNMFYQGFESDAIKTRLKNKYSNISVVDINDSVDKAFRDLGQKESYEEKLTLDDVAMKKFGKKYNQLNSEEKRECNYVYSEWSDDDYDEGCKKESFKVGDNY